MTDITNICILNPDLQVENAQLHHLLYIIQHLRKKELQYTVYFSPSGQTTSPTVHLNKKPLFLNISFGTYTIAPLPIVQNAAVCVCVCLCVLEIILIVALDF